MATANASASRRLTIALNHLNLAQAEVREAYRQLEIEQLPTEQQERPNVVEEETQHTRRGRRVNSHLIPGSSLRIGDWVEIVNARSHQEKEGEVIGLSGRGIYIVTQTPNGDRIKRIPRNLRVIPGGRQNGRYAQPTQSGPEQHPNPDPSSTTEEEWAEVQRF